MLFATVAAVIPVQARADNGITFLSHDVFIGLRDLFSGLADVRNEVVKAAGATQERIEGEDTALQVTAQLQDMAEAMQADLQASGGGPIDLGRSHTLEQFGNFGLWIGTQVIKAGTMTNPVGIVAAIGPEWAQFAGRTMGGDLSTETMLVLMKAVVKTAALCVGFLVASDIAAVGVVPVAVGIALSGVAGAAFDLFRGGLSQPDMGAQFVAVYDAINAGVQRAGMALLTTIQNFFGNDPRILAAISPDQADAANERYAGGGVQTLTRTIHASWTETCVNGLCARHYITAPAPDDPWVNGTDGRGPPPSSLPLAAAGIGGGLASPSSDGAVPGPVGGVIVNAPVPRATGGNPDGLGAAVLKSRTSGNHTWSVQ
jgi:hypothetical protein